MEKYQRMTTEQFEALSPEGQRIAIARDVIAQVEAKRLVAKAQVYMLLADRGAEDFELNGFGMIDGTCLTRLTEAEDVELRDAFAGRKCAVCAVGATFVAAIDLADNLKVGEVTSSYKSDTPMRAYLERWFSKVQLGLIEAAFERDRDFALWNEDDGDAAREAVEFGFEHPAVEDRLLAIMRNIVDNGGEFVP